MHVNVFDPSTFTWIFKELDIPWVEKEWNVLRDRAYAKDPNKITPQSVIGKYISKMKLKQWKDCGWADTERLQAEAEEEAKLHGFSEE